MASVTLPGYARHNDLKEGIHMSSMLEELLGTDHDGSILDSLGSIFGGNAWAQQQANRHGESILGHVFGQSRPRVEQQVQAASGLQSAMVSKLLPLLAPVVLGYLGKKLKGGGTNNIAEDLERERVQVKQDDGVFGSILDMLDGDDDNDGGGLMDMAGDMLKGQAGRMILGKLLGG